MTVHSVTTALRHELEGNKPKNLPSAGLFALITDFRNGSFATSRAGSKSGHVRYCPPEAEVNSEH
jgi:hypothetical protein